MLNPKSTSHKARLLSRWAGSGGFDQLVWWAGGRHICDWECLCLSCVYFSEWVLWWELLEASIKCLMWRFSYQEELNIWHCQEGQMDRRADGWTDRPTEFIHLLFSSNLEQKIKKSMTTAQCDNEYMFHKNMYSNILKYQIRLT